MTKIKKIKILGLLILVAILMAMIGLVFFFYIKKDQDKFSRNLPEIQNKIIAKFNSAKAYDITSSFPAGKMTGKYISPNSFQGDYETGNQQKYELKKVKDESFFKEKDHDWQKDDRMFTYELNIVTYPEWIQLQKRLADAKCGGRTCLQYEVIFEKPNQEIVKTLSQEQLDNLRITGTILVDKESLLLKQLKLYTGKEEKNSFTVDFSPTESSPKIEPPI